MTSNIHPDGLRALVTRRRRKLPLCRWPRFTLGSTLVLLGAAGAVCAWVPSWLAAGRALALFALVHAGFLCALEPGPAEEQ